MLSLFKSNTTRVCTYFKQYPEMEKFVENISPNNIKILLSIVDNHLLSKVVFESTATKYYKTQDALNNLLHNDQMLIYLESLNIYMLFNDVNEFTLFIRTAKNPTNIYQIIKHDMKQKLILNIIDEACVKHIQSLTSELSIERNNGFLWEITFNGMIYQNYKHMEEEYSKYSVNISPTFINKLFLLSLIRKGIHQYVRINISSAFTKDPGMVTKHIIYTPPICAPPIVVQPTTSQTKRLQTILKNNQYVTDWINVNPPEDIDTKQEYYQRFLKKCTRKDLPAQQTFSICVTNCGYDEIRKKGKMYWRLNIISFSDNDFDAFC